MKTEHNATHLISRVTKWENLLIVLVVLMPSCTAKNNVRLLNESMPLSASHLIWSPDSRALAFTVVTGNPPTSMIYTLEVETENLHALVDQDFGDVHAQGWSPDNSGLFFFAYSFKDSKQGTWVINTTGDDQPRFLIGDKVIAWSSMGDVAFSRKDNQSKEVSLYLKKANDNGETKIFSEIGVAINVGSWSADGSKLVFLFERSFSRENGIYVFDTQTMEVKQVVTDGNIWYPSFSPDGQMMAYTKGDPAGLQFAHYLHIVNFDNACDVEVPGRFDVFSSAWSPDGKWIAYTRKLDGGIYLLNLTEVFKQDILREGLPCS